MVLELSLLTIHNFNSPSAQRQYENCIGDCQAIRNPIISLREKNTSVFTGANSIGELMVGVRKNLQLEPGLDLTYGAYYQDNGKYKDRGLSSPTFMGDFVPVGGVDIYTKDYGLVITPVTTTFYLRF